MNIVIAKPVAVEVPLLVGRTRDEAAGILKNAELAIGDLISEESRRPSGTIVSQMPAAGIRVTVGSAVSLVLARPITVLVPDVVSRSEADARQALTCAELVAGGAVLAKKTALARVYQWPATVNPALAAQGIETLCSTMFNGRRHKIQVPVSLLERALGLPERERLS